MIYSATNFATPFKALYSISWFTASALLLFCSTSAQAGFSVLGGAPVTQGQMLISDETYERVKPKTSNPAQAQPAAPTFHLKETRVEAEISGVLARVRVSQVFQNPFSDRLEALYVFPLPENSAVDAYSFQIGERLIVGEVKERVEARQIYERARQDGRKAALLEQERANIFTQSVANIPANAEVVIHIEYVQPLEVDQERYLFRFPMVVGPRYIPGTPVSRPSMGRGWARDTDLVPDASRITPEVIPSGMRNGKDVFITVKIDGAMPIQAVTPVTHELNVEKRSETESIVTLKNQSVVPDQDFIFEYRLAGEHTTLASMTHRASSNEDGYVMLALQPKWSLDSSEITSREVLLVLDTSGSMNGPAMSQLRQFADKILDGLKAEDTFRVISFSNQARAFQPAAVPATSENIEAAKNFVRGLRANGGTNLLSALQLALGETQTESSPPRYLFLMTDALVGNDHSILRYLKDQRFQDARVFPVAFGAAPNDYLMKRAAEIGRGFSLQVTNQDNPVALAEQVNVLTNSPYMTDLQIDWGDLTVQDQVPERLPDLYAGKPLIVLAKYSQTGFSTVKLRGNVMGQPVELELELELPEIEPAHDSIGSVWARQRIRQIWNRDVGAETPAGKAEITELGLRHQLVTAYTSFIAVEKELEEAPEGKLITQATKVQAPEGMDSDATSSNAKPQAVSDKSVPASSTAGTAGSSSDQASTPENPSSTTSPASPRTQVAQANQSSSPPATSSYDSSRSSQYSSRPRSSFGAGGGSRGGGPIGPVSALLSLAGAGAASLMRRKKKAA
ncbi:MAG: VIT domain-containing protein [Rubripirellula sp.]